jgi:hypothetical protein
MLGPPNSTSLCWRFDGARVSCSAGKIRNAASGNFDRYQKERARAVYSWVE